MSDEVTVADAVVAQFAADGIRSIFGLTGGGIMFLLDAVQRSEDLSMVCVHHEQFAGVAADGYARTGQKYGVAFGTTGPGVAHLFPAALAAWQDSVPLILIAGQVKSSDSTRHSGLSVRQNGTFEFDALDVFRPVCKFVSIVTQPQLALSTLQEAIVSALSGRPGPVLLELPLDVQGAGLPAPSVAMSVHPTIPTKSDGLSDFVGDAQDAGVALSQALRVSSRPFALIGSGAIRAGVAYQVRDALATAGIPYATTQFARQVGSTSIGLYVGSPGVKANRSANMALSECDLLIVVGSSLHQQVVGWNSEAFKALPATKLWSEPDSGVREAREHLVDRAWPIPVQGFSRVLMQELASLANVSETKRWAPWRDRCRSLTESYFFHFPTKEPDDEGICLYELVSALSRFSAHFAAAVTDAGQAYYAMAQHYISRPDGFYLSSGSLGSMGVALPMGIGAATSLQDNVLVLTGDGSLMTSSSELATLRATNLPVLLVVSNNGGYASIRSTQDRFFSGRRIGTDSHNGVWIPNLERLAGAYELPFCRVSSISEVTGAVEAFLDASPRGPMMIEATTLRDQAVEPFIVSSRDEGGRMQSGSLTDLHPPLAGDDRD